MHVCFCCVRFSFSVLSQEVGWEERLQNDVLCRVYQSMHHSKMCVLLGGVEQLVTT